MTAPPQKVWWGKVGQVGQPQRPTTTPYKGGWVVRQAVRQAQKVGQTEEGQAMAKPKKKAGKAVATKRDPKPPEVAAMASARERFNKLPVRAEPTVTDRGNGTVAISADHSDDRGSAYQLQAAFASASVPFVSRSMKDLIQLCGKDAEGVGAAVAIIEAVAPQDELESALAQQMVAAHMLGLEMTRRALNATMLPQMNAYANIATKAQRTFAAQIDALGKLRNGGQQVVRHVHVYEGGQAIVVDEFHHHAGAGNREIAGQPFGTCGPRQRPAMLSADTSGDGLPIAGYAERALPAARREVTGGTEGE